MNSAIKSQPGIGIRRYADGGIVEKPSIVGFIKDRFKALVDSAPKPMLGIQKTVKKRMDDIDNAGADTVAAASPTPSPPPTPAPEFRFAEGGSVPGAGNSDTVDALLTPGEFVMPKDSVAAIGVNKLNAMKNATHQHKKVAQGYGVKKMANGGMVDPKDQTQFQFDDDRGGAASMARYRASVASGKVGQTDAEKYAPQNATSAGMDATSTGISKAQGAGQVIGAGINGASKIVGGVVSDLGIRPAAAAASGIGGFVGDVYQGATNPGGRPTPTPTAAVAAVAPPASAPAAVLPPKVTSTPTPTVGGVYPPGDPRGTMSSTVSLPAAVPAPAPQASPNNVNVGRDGMAVDAGGNPVAGYGSISVNGKQTNLSPASVGAQPSAAAVANPAAYAPTQYSSRTGTSALDAQTAALDAIHAQPKSFLDEIRSNVARKQADRTLGLGIQREGQQLQSQTQLATTAANNQAQLGIHGMATDSQEKIAAGNVASAQAIEESRADAIRKNAQVIHGRAIPQYDENGMHTGTDYEPDKVLTLNPDGTPKITEVQSQTPAPKAKATLPPGMKKQVGTSGGKPVYEDAAGKRFVGS